MITKNTLLGLGLLFCFQSAHANHNMREVPLENLLTPVTGFEEKNNIQVILAGSLPNFCYTLGETKVDRNLSTRQIRIRQFAVKQTDGMCENEKDLPDHMTMQIPFTSEISIGSLPKGEYTFSYDRSRNQSGSRPLIVSENIKSTVDTLPYASVSKIMALPVIHKNDPVEVTINGTLNSSCTELDPNIQVLNETDVFVIMPTIRRKSGVMCMPVLIPFEKKVNLGLLTPGQYLIHTRSMHGGAVNQIIQVVD